VDAGTADGQLLLTSFVWPFDLDRHVRLAAALVVAATHRVEIDQASASDWLPTVLAVADPDILPVVWHSITQMYWPAEELSAVETVLKSYGANHVLGEVSMEFDLDAAHAAKPELRTRFWNSATESSPRQRLLGTAYDHGIPVRLAST
jgi:hypothetical protein